MAKRYFEGELRQLRDKLSEKDVSLAKASRIQKELRWSLELYNRELSMIRGGGGSSSSSRGRTRSNGAAGASEEEEVAAGSRAHHASELEDVGATNLWYSPLGAMDTGLSGDSLPPSTPAPVPPPRHKKPLRSAKSAAANAGMHSLFSESSSSSSGSPPPAQGRRAHFAADKDVVTWNSMFGPGNQGLSVALRAAVGLEKESPAWGNAQTLQASSMRRNSPGAPRLSPGDLDGEQFSTPPWQSCSVGSLEVTGRMAADTDAKVDLLMRLRSDRDKLERSAAMQREVRCARVKEMCVLRVHAIRFEALAHARTRTHAHIQFDASSNMPAAFFSHAC
jgi:hypothetical protein